MLKKYAKFESESEIERLKSLNEEALKIQTDLKSENERQRTEIDSLNTDVLKNQNDLIKLRISRGYGK